MLTFEGLLNIAGTLAIVLGLYLLFNYIFSLERKYDLKCFLLGDIIFMIFSLLILFSPIQQAPELISALVIAELTLALVWVELSKRPELKLGEFNPIIYSEVSTALYYKANFHNEPIILSKLFGVKQVSYEDYNFDERFSFSVDLSNIGYEPITVHEYRCKIDGERKGYPEALISPDGTTRLRIATQERNPIDIGPLNLNTVGFHRFSIEFIASTMKCSREIWFSISEDFKKLTYVERSLRHRLFSGYVKGKLKDP